MGEAELEAALAFFKALADQSRLRILGLLAERSSTVEELAAALSLRPPTVSHHLLTLREAGLVTMRPEGTAHRYSLDLHRLQSISRELLQAEKVASLAATDVDEAWQRKVLRDFFAGEELKEIPASRKKRLVILQWLAGRFEPGRRYREGELNEILSRHHPDFATLRREFIATGLMQREAGVYWRTPQNDATDPAAVSRRRP